MKKLFSIAMFALVAASFTSCKKDYTCTCTITSGGVTSTTASPLGKQTKSDATTACNTLDAAAKTAAVAGGSGSCTLN